MQITIRHLFRAPLYVCLRAATCVDLRLRPATYVYAVISVYMRLRPATRRRHSDYPYVYVRL
jgi:hypothetical protein